MRVLQRRPTNRVDAWDEAEERYVRAMATVEGLALVEVRNRGTIDAPDLRFDMLSGSPSSATQRVLERTMRQILGLDVDPMPLARASEREPRLAAATVVLRGMRPPRFAALFEAFGSVIPFQQVSLDAGVAVVGRLVERFGRVLEYGGRRFHTFPDAARVAAARVEAIRACGLSLRKAETVRRIATAIEAGHLTPQQLSSTSSEDAIRCLTELAGIGPWTASVVLLRGLGRLDVFPPGDVGATRGLARVTGLPAGASLARIIQRFGDRRGYLYFYALGSALAAKGLIHSAPPRRAPRGRDTTSAVPVTGSASAPQVRGR